MIQEMCPRLLGIFSVHVMQGTTHANQGKVVLHEVKCHRP